MYKYLTIFGCDNELWSCISRRKLLRLDGCVLVFNTMTSPVTTSTAYIIQSKTMNMHT